MPQRRGEPDTRNAPPDSAGTNTPLQERPRQGAAPDPETRYQPGQDDRRVHLNPDGYAPTRSVPAGDEDDTPSLPTSEGDQGFKR
ncbi:MAG TPA: hypothetical protein VK447_14465 [Myxococcaceae bacterium]|nr:hypothetical protein [Myxococcaceae bacterium]